VDGVLVPLNADVVTDLSQRFANSAIFANNVGLLDAAGSATVGFDTLGPRPFLAGTSWDFVCVILDGPNGNVLHATAPTRIDF